MAQKPFPQKSSFFGVFDKNYITVETGNIVKHNGRDGHANAYSIRTINLSQSQTKGKKQHWAINIDIRNAVMGIGIATNANAQTSDAKHFTSNGGDTPPPFSLIDSRVTKFCKQILIDGYGYFSTGHFQCPDGLGYKSKQYGSVYKRGDIVDMFVENNTLRFALNGKVMCLNCGQNHEKYVFGSNLI